MAAFETLQIMCGFLPSSITALNRIPQSYKYLLELETDPCQSSVSFENHEGLIYESWFVKLATTTELDHHLLQQVDVSWLMGNTKKLQLFVDQLCL